MSTFEQFIFNPVIAGKVCTGFEFIPRTSGALVDYTSRVSDPTGRWSNITGRLSPNEDMVDGNFYQSFPWSEDPGVSWNIIYLDNDWAIEYDWYVLIFSTLKNMSVRNELG